MEETNFLREQNIAIIGLGLMGASIAMGLRGHCKSVLGSDSDSLTCQIATAKGMVDSASTDLRQILPQADILIIATPVSAALKIIAALPGIHNGSKLIVTDVTSTKEQIMRALDSLPSNFDVIGGHPICGKEKLGICHAEKEMLYDCTYTLTPSERTSARTKSLLAQLVEAIGGNPLWIDAVKHDQMLAKTSHAPHLLAVALMHATEADLSKLKAGGFSSATRLSATPTSMMLPMVMTNAENTIAALEAVKTEIDKILTLMKAGDNENLEILLDTSKAKREEMMRRM
ncbi:MAG: prephenate dehydrogenase [Anaerolineae bacterium]|jgi:prephenate dehydrogenase|nr:prephenate dehydrogenase [Anaerolineae bacterium]MBT7072135.1 prephenate dehydrogenase [Anaerolineae bacterium]MBT7326784.1 prephenate dehydrogenase [Anaerolineae bacterium]